MIFEHLRNRRDVSLLAAGVLRGAPAEAARRHLQRCPRCRADHDEVVALMRRLDEDPIRGAEPELPLPVLVARVEAEVLRTLTGPRARLGWRLVTIPVAAAAALAAIALVPRIVREVRPTPAPETVAPEAPAVSEDALARLERNVAREQAVRYLAEAQDVLVNVAASPRDCEREDGAAGPPPAETRVDLEAESRRSRELLTRRALLVEAHEAAVLPAQPVLEDVADMLREVALLESCTRAEDLARLREEIEKRQLLMKMRLVQRELAG
jgi:hypothetical protein